MRDSLVPSPLGTKMAAAPMKVGLAHFATSLGLADSALPGSYSGPISLLPGIGVIGAMSHTVGNYIISYIAFLSNSGVVLYLCTFQTLSIHSLNWMVAIFQ